MLIDIAQCLEDMLPRDGSRNHVHASLAVRLTCYCVLWDALKILRKSFQKPVATMKIET